MAMGLPSPFRNERRENGFGEGGTWSDADCHGGKRKSARKLLRTGVGSRIPVALNLLIIVSVNFPRFPVPLVFAALVTLAEVGTARANLFVNPSFESGTVPAVNGVTAFGALAPNAANSPIQGWGSTIGTGNAGTSNYLAGRTQTADGWIPAAQNGNYSVQLDSRPGGGTYTIGNSVYQALNLTANTSYSLSFYFRSETGNTTGTLTSVGAYVGLDAQGNVPVNALGYVSIASQRFVSPVAVDTGWNLATLNFTTGITGGLYRFTFLDSPQSLTNTGYATAAAGADSNVSLDNFQLDVVPEFSHWAVFGVFGLLVAGGRRLRTPSWHPFAAAGCGGAGGIA